MGCSHSFLASEVFADTCRKGGWFFKAYIYETILGIFLTQPFPLSLGLFPYLYSYSMLLLEIFKNKKVPEFKFAAPF
jgi:hypothetical protein